MVTDAAEKTALLTSMVLWIIIGCLAFSAVVNTLGLPLMLKDFIDSLGINRWVVLIAMQLSFFLLGMVMDDLPIIMITVPIYVPLSHCWDLIPCGSNSFYCEYADGLPDPPFGFVLFYMKGVVPPHITMGDIYRSVWPFIGLQALCLLIIISSPRWFCGCLRWWVCKHVNI